MTRSATSARAALVALGLASLGCAPEAVLDLQVMLPARAASGEARVASIQTARAAGHPFDAPWSDEGFEVELDDAPTLAAWSVLASDPATDLHLKIRFCRERGCAGGAVGERWFALEHPFYVDRRTSWASCITSAPITRPDAPLEVDRCQIRGCLVGGVPERWCRFEGHHYCETLETDRRPRELSCHDDVAYY